jgi:hypothetical protein
MASDQRMGSDQSQVNVNKLSTMDPAFDPSLPGDFAIFFPLPPACSIWGWVKTLVNGCSSH